jgi:DNA-binding NtrC family response regulator
MQSAANALEPEAPEPLRALVVDDEAHVRRMLQRGLARAGFVTAEVPHGQAALELLRRESFDLVISDVQMPVMNGPELLEALEREGLELPVLLISGSLEVPDVATARRLGAFDFFRKPFSVAELAHAAMRAAQSRRTSREGLRAWEQVDAAVR